MTASWKTGGVKEEVDDDLIAVATSTYGRVLDKMKELRVADAITEIFNLFKRCNKYIDETAPWVLVKDEAKKDRLATVLYNLTEGILMGASLLEPFLPDTAAKISAQLNAPLRDFDTLGEFGKYPDKNKVTAEPKALFARLDIKDVLAEAERIAAIQKAEVAAESGETNAETEEADGIDIEPKATISYDDFAKLQFQVGEILSCEEVKKSRKLLCSQVKVGSKVLQIVSGIKSSYSAEEMVGKKVMVLTNLAPATLAGIESQGMLLSAEDQEGKLSLLIPEKDMPNGAEIC